MPWCSQGHLRRTALWLGFLSFSLIPQWGRALYTDWPFPHSQQGPEGWLAVHTSQLLWMHCVHDQVWCCPDSSCLLPESPSLSLSHRQNAPWQPALHWPQVSCTYLSPHSDHKLLHTLLEVKSNLNSYYKWNHTIFECHLWLSTQGDVTKFQLCHGSWQDSLCFKAECHSVMSA